MSISKKVIIPSLILGAMFYVGAYGVGTTLASENENGQDTIVQRIAERFNLNTNEVQEVFNENQENRQAEMQERQEERLAQAVSEGKLSEEQKELLLSKMEENRAERGENRETFRGMTYEEKMNEREEHQEEMQGWMEENGVDHDDLMGTDFGMRGGHRGGFGLGK
ncbi:MAG: hypothetical protein PF549_00205 [Patescibacteria group bacterium]|jgi:cytidylate kinase|nr:hypothetical protein [Patescibacteria group bacterium]